MADIDCTRCGATHEIYIDPDRPFERVECSCGADLTDMANTCWAIVSSLLAPPSAGGNG